MPASLPDNVWDKLQRALSAVDAVADPNGPHQLKIGGTVNILGGGSGGTAQSDDSAFIPTSSSLTPAGAYVGGRQVGSGHIGAPAMSASAILQVHVVAGGAGGGLANLTVKGTANNDVNVGVASGAAGAAGNWAIPVVYASGQYPTVNLGNIATVNVGALPGVVGSVVVTPLTTFTVALDKIPTVNLGLGTVNVGAMPGLVGSVRTTGLGGSIGALGIGGSMSMIGAGGSIGVAPLGDFTVWLANAGAGGGFATVGVYGSVGVTGSVRVTPAGDFTVWLANAAAGSGFASVGVYGSVGVAGSVFVTPVASFTVNLASHIDTAGSAVRVNVVAGGAGGGVAQLQVTGTSGTYLGVGYASGPAQAVGNMALPVLYASGFYPTVNLGNIANVVGSVFAANLGGSVGVIGAGGSMGAVNLGGSVGVLGIGGSFPVVGSVNVTPVATFTVSLDKVPTVNLGAIPTVNLGLGTVNIGNTVVVDVSDGLTLTQWPIAFGGSGYSALSIASANPAVRTKLTGITLISTGTIDMSFQSPSGTFLTGSLRIVPGAGFAKEGAINNPVLIGGSNATLFIHAAGTQNVGGWLIGYVE